MIVWLHGGTFQIHHKGLSTRVPCNRGIKQVSRGGPYQWNLMTRYLLWRLCQSKGVKWVQEHIVNFADDFHVSWLSQTEISMHQVVRDMADVLAILEDFCLRINLGTSAAIIRFTGQTLGLSRNNIWHEEPEECTSNVPRDKAERNMCRLSKDWTIWEQ